jgi:hypothetical protein
MWALPCDVYDLEPRSRYENEEPVLACRKTVNQGENCQSLRIPPAALHSIRTEGEALVLSISILPLDASDQHVATRHR